MPSLHPKFGSRFQTVAHSPRTCKRAIALCISEERDCDRGFVAITAVPETSVYAVERWLWGCSSAGGIPGEHKAVQSLGLLQAVDYEPWGTPSGLDHWSVV